MSENTVCKGKGYAVVEQKKVKREKGEKEKVKKLLEDFQGIDFCDIDVNYITFGAPKENNHNGLQIPILYKGKTPYIKYKGVTPFGIKENYDPTGNYLGTSMQINLQGDYLKKAQELDQFFIDSFFKYKWNLSSNVPKGSIAGYDEHGQGGSWRRMCKKSYKINKITKEREYNNYPSKMEFVLFYRNDKLETSIFDENGNKVQYTDVVAYSQVRFILLHGFH